VPSDLDRLGDDLGDTDFRAVAREVLGDAAAQIGSAATTKFMRTGGTGVGANNQSGPGTLRRQTGRLARSLTGARSAQGSAGSIRAAPEGVFDLSPTAQGVKLTYGSEVPYAAVHEYGFSGRVQVPQHTREQTHAFGREMAPQTVTVRAHSRQMNIPERPYLLPALRDSLDDVEALAERKIADAITSRTDE